MTKATLRITARQLLLATLCTGLAMSGGCVAAAAMLSRVTPETPTAAMYTPAHDNLLVLVESYQNPASIAVAADHMDRLIAEDLIAHKVAPVVNPDLLTDLRNTKLEEYRQMKIPAIGRAVGAKQVLYADVLSFSTDTAIGSGMVKARAEARIRVVDCATGETRWPKDMSGGYAVVMDIPYSPKNEGVTDAAIRERLAVNLAGSISRLFHGYTSDELDGTDPKFDSQNP